MTLEEGKNYKALMKTSLGTITIDLYEELMPITVNNFVFLANEGYYNGVIFHRVIDGFMIQGGDPSGTGRGGPGYAIADEFKEGSTNVRGTISMANAGPNSGGSQFFINLVDNTRLDWDKEPSSSKHPVFGIVTEGMSVVDAIGNVQTAGADRPVTDVVIENVEIVTE
ncbi:MAG: peptidylprolyl isomerase [Patescibacteria group bacterium]